MATGLAEMTRSSHNAGMKKVRIAELKARLSHYLRLVRKGTTITVCDRDTPVARIEPIRPEPYRLTITKPAPGTPRIHEIPLPPPLGIEIDVVALLREDRDER